MIKRENFTEDYIRALQKQSRRDPVLLERTIYAFGLLEAISLAGLPFIFKGGTCLMLLLNKPRRLSTDIDIIVEPGTDVDAFIDKAAQIFPFVHQEEQVRIGRNKIVKRHFKFTYNSPINKKPFYILLDVLFEHHHYAKIVEKEIRNDLLAIETPNTTVRIPSVECILGDKLTAFAPHTTGIPLNIGKDMEVMKQLYDVSTLLEVFEDFDLVRDTYWKIAKDELAYRGSDSSVEGCLADTFRASLCIASRGKFLKDEYRLYVAGIRELRGHIYSENYSPEVAVGRATKAAYMALCLLTGHAYEKIADYKETLAEQLNHEELSSVRFLRKAAPEAYAYMVKTDHILASALQLCPYLFEQ